MTWEISVAERIERATHEKPLMSWAAWLLQTETWAKVFAYPPFSVEGGLPSALYFRGSAHLV